MEIVARKLLQSATAQHYGRTELDSGKENFYFFRGKYENSKYENSSTKKLPEERFRQGVRKLFHFKTLRL